MKISTIALKIRFVSFPLFPEVVMDVDKSPEISDVTEKIRTKYVRLKCFEIVTELDRNNIIKHFNGLPDQDS